MCVNVETVLPSWNIVFIKDIWATHAFATLADRTLTHTTRNTAKRRKRKSIFLKRYYTFAMGLFPCKTFSSVSGNMRLTRQTTNVNISQNGRYFFLFLFVSFLFSRRIQKDRVAQEIPSNFFRKKMTNFF